MDRNIYCTFLHKIAYQLKDPFDIYVFGSSMEPCLKNGQKVTVIPLAKISDIFLGDIIVFYKFADHFTIHRVVGIERSSKEEIYQTKGDNNKDIDSYLVNRNEIVGVVYINKERRNKF